VNEFVEECRREWKRLGVPDPVAGEMAADLAADLEEAAAEGASPEEVLGSGAFDPRAFAVVWAAERGVIQQPLPRVRGLTRGSRLAAAIGTFALILAIVGAVLVIVDSSSDPARLALASPVDLPSTAVWVTPVTPSDVPAPARPPSAFTLAADGRVIMLRLPAPPGAQIVAADADDSGIDGRTFGSLLLIVGLAGVVPSTLFLWLGPGRGRAAVRTTTTA
jgi:hypothetical protein